MNFKVVIPARYASQRLPGKPLLEICGQPMIRHVWERAIESGAAEVVIATDDSRIVAACRKFSADVCVTAAEHTSGTDRIAEVARVREWDDNDIVVNLQGDEPLMPAANIIQVAELLLLDERAVIATLATSIKSPREFMDSAVVKVVHDVEGRALYFSRQPIPANRDAAGATPACALRHLGLYAYRVAALQQLAASPPCELESLERLEQLRALWLGLMIRVDVAREMPGRGVDTLEDLEAVSRQLRELAT